ncbi:MAG: HD domain-containing protein [Desulfobacteraceae bacterium]|nr:MAG: HD domain-containing protein [Desulfobacteraceae bacterium]
MPDEKPLYNSRIIGTYIKLIANKYSYINVTELLEYSGMTPYEVEDQGHWFTQKQVDLFYERLVKLTGNFNIAREAGLYAASPDAIGSVRQYVLGMIGPYRVCEMIGKTTANLTRSSRYDSRKISANKVEILVTPRNGVEEKPFQCENRKGFFEAIFKVFDNKIPKIEHPECMFKGDDVCRYIISWETQFSTIWRKACNYIAVFAFIVFSGSLFLFPVERLLEFSPFAMLIVLLLSLLTMVGERMEKNEMKESLNNLNDSTDQLLEQIEINYNNARLINEIGQAISMHTEMEDVLAKVIQITEKRLDFDRGLILLANKEKTRLEFRAGFGYRDDKLTFLKNASFHLNRSESKGIFVVAFREQKPYLINDIDMIGNTLSLRSLQFAKKLGSQSFICCPIVCDGEPLGILAVDNIKTKRPLLQSDMNLLMGIAPVIGVSIRNAELLKARTEQMNSILEVMAASIDARDPMTAGHSKKVKEYALGICEELGLSSDYSEVVGVAASLHDYGKIGVPDSLLKKEGKLTEEEYEIIKTHAEKTRKILSQMKFEGMLRQVPEIAGSHHEKLDGSGYPVGLKGDEIPLGAQIIAVADFFEAITANRHYRNPMPIDRAFRLLRNEANIHFRQKIIEAFTRYYTKKYNMGKNLKLVSSM